MEENKKRKSEKALLLTIAILWALVCLFPIWNLVSATFSSDKSNLTTSFWPNDISNGIGKIAYALTTGNILVSIIDTFAYSIVTIVGMVIISALVAYEFTFYRFPLKKLLFALMMASMMLPLVLYVIPLYRFVYEMNLSDTLIGISFPMMVSPLAVFILMQFLEDLPMSFIESARIDGAGHFNIFRSIVLPLMRNGIITVTVIMFLKVWGSYLWPSLITADSVKPLSVTIANMLSPNFHTDARVKIASMLISMLPPAVIYLICQKQVIEGITMQGVKG